MFQQNIRGLGIHKAKLEEFAGSFRGIDLLGLSEMHLSNMTTSEELKINGYNFERMNRTLGKGGGVGIYIKEDLVYYRRRGLEKY